MGGESHSPFVFDENAYLASINYYKMLLVDMIKAGKYDWENKDITDAHFQFTGEGTADVKLHLVCLARTATTKEIEEYLEVMNLRPATLAELLAFGAKYPDKQLEFPIVALGSDWIDPDGDPCVPYLDRHDDERYLDLSWNEPDHKWDDDFRFLAVSNK